MSPELLQMVTRRDEPGLERAYFEDECPHFLAVDWGEDDAEIVAMCARVLKLDSLKAEWRDEALFILMDGREVEVPLKMDVGDRHITVCTLNEVLSPHHEVRFLAFSHGSDTLGFAALSCEEWRQLEQANAEAVGENFIDPRTLPNLMTELTQDTLPPKPKARYERMLARNSRA